MKTFASALAGLSLMVGALAAQTPAASTSNPNSTDTTKTTKVKKHKKHAAAKSTQTPASDSKSTTPQAK
jgi:hypothetical protein